MNINNNTNNRKLKNHGNWTNGSRHKLIKKQKTSRNKWKWIKDILKLKGNSEDNSNRQVHSTKYLYKKEKQTEKNKKKSHTKEWRAKNTKTRVLDQ